jgi:Na+-translocating ferredoxin:NAD+ oxidoreductase RnfC subunit
VAWAAFENGLLAGRRRDADDVVDWATRSIVFVPAAHVRVRDEAVPLSDRIRQAASVCQHCRTCTDGCPVWLTRGGLQPHLLTRQLARSFAAGQIAPAPEEDATTLASLTCLGCRVCTLRCPAGVDPARLVEATAAGLREAGAELGQPLPLAPQDGRAERLLSLERVLQVYRPGADRTPAIDRRPYRPVQLALPLSDPRGEPRPALVGRGDELRRGELLTRQTPTAVPLHAPCGGRVEAVDVDRGLLLRCR